MIRAACRATSGLLAVVLAWCPLSAQQGSAVDVGAGVVRFPEDHRWIAGPWLRASTAREGQRDRWRAAATTIASGSGASGSAEAAASHQGGPIWRRLAWDGGGETSLLFGNVTHASGSILATAHLLVPFAAGGVRLGSATNLAHRESGLLRGHSLEAGAWWRLPRATMLASLVRQWAQGQLFADAGRRQPLGVVPVQYVEGTASVLAERRWGTLEATAGLRRDPDAEQRTEALWSLGAVVRASERLGVTVNVARQPADYLRGADAMQSVSLGLRFSTGRSAAVPRSRPGAVVELVSDAGDGTRMLRLRAPGAHTAEVMGDFTGWEAVALAASGGDFLLPSSLAPGAHRLLVRLDGGAWMVPTNTPAVDDDLGGRVGLMVVP